MKIYHISPAGLFASRTRLRLATVAVVFFIFACSIFPNSEIFVFLAGIFVCLIGLFWDGRFSEAISDIDDTLSLLSTTSFTSSELVKKRMGVLAQELEVLFSEERKLLRLDERDVTDQGELKRVRNNIYDSKKYFWRIHRIATRWGLKLPETIGECAKLASADSSSVPPLGGDSFGKRAGTAG